MINLINLLGLTPFLVSIFQNRFHVYSMLILLVGILYYTNNSNESIRNIDRGLCLTLGILVILGSVYVFGNIHSSTWFYGIALLAVYAYNTIWCSRNHCAYPQITRTITNRKAPLSFIVLMAIIMSASAISIEAMTPALEVIGIELNSSYPNQ